MMNKSQDTDEVGGNSADLEERNEFLVNQLKDLNNINFTLKEQLKQESDENCRMAVKTDDLSMENTQLREALERITKEPHDPRCGWFDNKRYYKCYCVNKIAQQALSGKELKPSRKDMEALIKFAWESLKIDYDKGCDYKGKDFKRPYNEGLKRLKAMNAALEGK